MTIQDALRKGLRCAVAVSCMACHSQAEQALADPLEPPDYGSSYCWVMYDEAPGQPFDVFFVHPTSYFTTNSGYNASLSDEVVRHQTDLTTHAKASVFESTCNVFAPRYRQVSIAVLTMPSEDAEPYFQVAEADILDAFMHYLNHCNKGRPYFLASHSQGSDLLLRFLRKHRGLVDHRLLMGAYCPGWTFTDQDLDEIGVPLAVTPTQVGGLVVWNTIGEGGISPTLRPGARCINPLAWTPATNEVPASMNECAVIHFADGTATNVPNMTSARIDASGGLVVSPPSAYTDLLSFAMGPNVYHSYDYDLFYSNIVENIELRCAVWGVAGR